MYGLSNGENIFNPWCPLKVKGQGQTPKTLKSKISKTVRDRKKVSIEVRYRFRDIRLQSFQCLTLTFDL